MMTKKLREYVRVVLEEEFQSHTYEPLPGDYVKNTNANCTHHGSMGKVLSVDEMPGDAGKIAKYVCVNSGEAWSLGDVLQKTLDQLSPCARPYESRERS